MEKDWPWIKKSLKDRHIYLRKENMSMQKKRSYVFLVTRLEWEMENRWFSCQRAYSGSSVPVDDP